MIPLKITTKIQIQKPISDVYNAVIKKDHLSKFFIRESDKDMESDTQVFWSFPEFEGTYPVKILKLQPYSSIEFEWDVDNKPFKVKIEMEEKGVSDTVVTVTEEGNAVNNPEGIKWLQGNTEGWANFLACMKAYLEYGINLRKGAFDFHKKA